MSIIPQHKPFQIVRKSLFPNGNAEAVRVNASFCSNRNGKKRLGVGKVKIIHDRNGFQNWVFVQDVDQDILGHLAFFRKSSDKHGFGLRVSLQNCCQIAREFVITVFFGLFQKKDIVFYLWGHTVFREEVQK